MPYIVKLTSPTGEVSYGSAPDHEGLRYLTTAERAEKFGTKSGAESAFALFKQIRQIADYTYEAVEA
jgi:hypothetical protein